MKKAYCIIRMFKSNQRNKSSVYGGGENNTIEQWGETFCTVGDWNKSSPLRFMTRGAIFLMLADWTKLSPLVVNVMRGEIFWGEEIFRDTGMIV